MSKISEKFDLYKKLQDAEVLLAAVGGFKALEECTRGELIALQLGAVNEYTPGTFVQNLKKCAKLYGTSVIDPRVVAEIALRQASYRYSHEQEVGRWSVRSQSAAHNELVIDLSNRRKEALLRLKEKVDQGMLPMRMDSIFGPEAAGGTGKNAPGSARAASMGLKAA